MANDKKEKYIARGKKTVNQLAEFARKNGEEKISIIEEKEKKPHHLAIIRITELGSWTWEEERLLNQT